MVIEGHGALQALFDDLNHRYFRNRLPGYRVELLKRSRRWVDVYGICDHGRRVIGLSRELTGSTAPSLREILLHEMAHAAAPGSGHGRRWRAQMFRLAEQGEHWARRVAERHAAGPDYTLTAEVESRLEELATGLEDLAWPMVLRRLWEELAVTAHEVSFLVPAAERRWRTLRAQRLGDDDPFETFDEA